MAAFAWGVVAWNVAVVAWGAYVRATGSGAGCGSHWPLCNGELIPHSPTAATLIEYTHRATSGLAVLAIAALAAWTWRATPRRHAARPFAVAAVLLVLNEAVLGASLVLYEHVAQDRSVARVVSLSLHFANTFLLLAALTLTAHLAADPSARRRWPPRTAGLWAGVAVLSSLMLVGVTGAIAALGDTLFPARSLAEAVRQDWATGDAVALAGHGLLRLRLLHPLAAGLAVAAVVWATGVAWRSPPIHAASLRRAVAVCLACLAGQFALGGLDVLLLAPVWLQLAHLVGGDALWIASVRLAALIATAPGPAALPADRPARLVT